MVAKWEGAEKMWDLLGGCALLVLTAVSLERSPKLPRAMPHCLASCLSQTRTLPSDRIIVISSRHQSELLSSSGRIFICLFCFPSLSDTGFMTLNYSCYLEWLGKGFTWWSLFSVEGEGVTYLLPHFYAHIGGCLMRDDKWPPSSFGMRRVTTITPSLLMTLPGLEISTG